MKRKLIAMATVSSPTECPYQLLLEKEDEWWRLWHSDQVDEPYGFWYLGIPRAVLAWWESGSERDRHYWEMADRFQEWMTTKLGESRVGIEGARLGWSDDP